MRKGFRVPALKSAINFLISSADRVSIFPYQVYFFMLDEGSRILRVGVSSLVTPMKSASLS